MSKGIRSWRGGLNVAPTRAPDAGHDRLAGLGRLAGLVMDVRGHAQAMRLGAAARNNRALGRGALVAVVARGLPPTHVQLEPRRLVRAAGVALAPRLRRARVLGAVERASKWCAVFGDRGTTEDRAPTCLRQQTRRPDRCDAGRLLVRPLADPHAVEVVPDEPERDLLDEVLSSSP